MLKRGSIVEYRAHGLVITATVTAASSSQHPGRVRINYDLPGFGDQTAWVPVAAVKEAARCPE
jgi:hypothetical protein